MTGDRLARFRNGADPVFTDPEPFVVMDLRYERAYGGTYAPRDYRARLDERVSRLRVKYGFAEDSMRKRDLVPGPSISESRGSAERNTQLSLPL